MANGTAGGTITDEVRRRTGIGGETSLERQRRFCISQGGKWDAENNRCIRLSELEAQELATRREEAKETVNPKQPETIEPTVEQPQLQPQATEQPAQRDPRAELIGAESRAGQALRDVPTAINLNEGQAQFLGQAVPAAGGALVAAFGAQAALQAVAPAVGNFLGKFAPKTATAVKTAAAKAAPGSRALGTNPRALGTNPRAVQAVLTAPSKLRAAAGFLKGGVAAAATLFGLNQVKSVGTDLLLAESKKVRSKVGLVGERLTKIPETSSHGFTVEDGVVKEYTHAMALKDIADTKQTLLDAEQQLQQASIGNAFLKLKGDHDLAMDEVEKQLIEIGVAQSKVLEQIAAPSEKSLAVKEFWEGVDLE